MTLTIKNKQNEILYSGDILRMVQCNNTGVEPAINIFINTSISEGWLNHFSGQDLIIETPYNFIEVIESQLYLDVLQREEQNDYNIIIQGRKIT